MLFEDKNRVSVVRVSPVDAVPGVTTTITLSATVVDIDNVPVSGATVTWHNTLDEVGVNETSDTDASGVAILDVKLTDLTAGLSVFPFIAYLDSDPSTGTTGTIRLASTDNPIPQINDGGDFKIDQYDIASGVTITIQAYPDATRGDLVNFYWDDIHSLGKTIADPATDFPWVINAKTSLPPECLVNGQYSLYYQFRDSNGNFGVSMPRKETVNGSQPAPTLLAPDFPEADGNGGWINSMLALNGTPASVTWKNMQKGDLVNLTWVVYDQNGVQLLLDDQFAGTVTDEQVTAGSMDITVPSTDIPQGIQNGSAKAWYTMTPANGSDLQSSAVANVGIDTKA
ncbi:Ig-like domain-containing protein [Lelliottia amnigena]|uniref:Ig-like domain-containing protein n=1 Tax=Lelliottia amnigena TaxID=61646 RepID=UPI00192C20A6|nr:Ig-like domain-containing protein [Lelliottia amnigena]MBL5922476.1 Ig-like domain-containing protein [Lelliottia amnigena]